MRKPYISRKYLNKAQAMGIKENLKVELKKRNLNRMDLVKLTGIPKSTIYSISEGTSIETVEKIAETLNISIEELTGKEGNSLKKLSKRLNKLKKDEQENIIMMIETAISTYEKRKFASKVHH